MEHSQLEGTRPGAQGMWRGDQCSREREEWFTVCKVAWPMIKDCERYVSRWFGEREQCRTSVKNEAAKWKSLHAHISRDIVRGGHADRVRANVARVMVVQGLKIMARSVFETIEAATRNFTERLIFPKHHHARKLPPKIDYAKLGPGLRKHALLHAEKIGPSMARYSNIRR